MPYFLSSLSAEVDVRIRKWSNVEAVNILAGLDKISDRIMAAFLCVCGLSGRSSDRQTKQLEPTADTGSVQIPGERFNRAFTSRTYATQTYMHKWLTDATLIMAIIACLCISQFPACLQTLSFYCNFTHLWWVTAVNSDSHFCPSDTEFPLWDQ